MGWADDLWGATKKVGHGAVEAGDWATDNLVSKDSWGRTIQAMADGPGGKEVKWGDVANMGLDTLWLVPGAGVAGGLARTGGRVAARQVEKELLEAAAKRTVDKTLLRSPANNAVRRFGDDAVKTLTSKGPTKGARVRAGLKSGGEPGARTAGKAIANQSVSKGAARAAARPVSRNQVSRMAAKQEAGFGRRFGFGQTKRRIALNAGLVGAAELGTKAYDSITGGGLTGPNSPSGTDGDGSVTVQFPQYGPGYAPGTPGSLYITGANGQAQAVPEGFMAALAEFMAQNGTVDGKQVIYNK